MRQPIQLERLPLLLPLSGLDIVVPAETGCILDAAVHIKAPGLVYSWAVRHKNPVETCHASIGQKWR